MTTIYLSEFPKSLGYMGRIITWEFQIPEVLVVVKLHTISLRQDSGDFVFCEEVFKKGLDWGLPSLDFTSYYPLELNDFKEEDRPILKTKTEFLDAIYSGISYADCGAASAKVYGNHDWKLTNFEKINYE